MFVFYKTRSLTQRPRAGGQGKEVQRRQHTPHEHKQTISIKTGRIVMKTFSKGIVLAFAAVALCCFRLQQRAGRIFGKNNVDRSVSHFLQKPVTGHL